VTTVSRVAKPMYPVATERDHVSPWRSVYKIHQLAHSPVDFVLVSGGHNVGIVSPPEGPAASPEAAYRVARSGPHQAPLDSLKWQSRPKAHKGSWWPHWHQWLHRHSSGRVPARAVRPLLPSGEADLAPGTYVFQT
jgi:polyhydroxyalkanoate synthase